MAEKDEENIIDADIDEGEESPWLMPSQGEKQTGQQQQPVLNDSNPVLSDQGLQAAQVAGAGASSPAAQTPPPLSGLRRWVKPGGHFNRNLIICGALGIAVACGVAFNSMPSAAKAEGPKSSGGKYVGAGTSAKESGIKNGARGGAAVKPVEAGGPPDQQLAQKYNFITPTNHEPTNQTFTVPAAGSLGGTNPAGGGVKVARAAPSSLANNAPGVAGSLSGPATSPGMGSAGDSFGSKLDFSRRGATDAEEGAKNDPGGVLSPEEGIPTESDARTAQLSRIPTGAKITMRLKDGLISGVDQTAEAVVTADVKGKDGSIVIPRGSIAFIPFSGAERNGRLIAKKSPGLIRLPDGFEIPLNGSVAQDGAPGIKGEIKRTGGGGWLRKGVRLGVSSGASMLGALGGIGGGSAIYEAENAIGGDSVGSYSSTREVSVAPGATFIFRVGL